MLLKSSTYLNTLCSLGQNELKNPHSHNCHKEVFEVPNVFLVYRGKGVGTVLASWKVNMFKSKDAISFKVTIVNSFHKPA